MDNGNINESFVEDKRRPYVAVVSLDGAQVSQDLGRAKQLWVYESLNGRKTGFALKDVRATPPPGGGDARWERLAETLKDCRALLVMAAGPKPRKILTKHGIGILRMQGAVEAGLRAVYGKLPASPDLARCGGDGASLVGGRQGYAEN
jgi:nitrogen fixation protein NifB